MFYTKNGSNRKRKMLFPKTLALLLSILTFSAFAQQDFIFQSEGQRSFWFNPASIGTYNLYSANSVAKTQWTNIDQAPFGLQINGALKCLAFANGEAPFSTGAVGLAYRFERFGVERSHFISVPINMQFKLNNSYLSIGISPGLHSLNYKGIWLPPTGVFDPNIPPVGLTKTRFTGGAGMQWFNHKFSLGLASTHLIPERFGELNYESRRQYYLQGSYKQRLTRSFSLEGMSILRADGFLASLTGMLYGVFNRKKEFSVGNEFSIGLGYRNGHSFLGALTARFNRIYVGYFLENFRSHFTSIAFSHEIRIAFELFDESL